MELLYIIIIIIIIFLVIYYLNTIRKELFFSDYTELLTDIELNVTKISKEEIIYDVSFKLTRKVIDEITNKSIEKNGTFVHIRWAPNYYIKNSVGNWVVGKGFQGYGFSEYNVSNLTIYKKIIINNITQLEGEKNGLIDYNIYESDDYTVASIYRGFIISSTVLPNFFTKTLQDDFIFKNQKDFTKKKVNIKSNDNCPIMKSLYDNIFDLEDTYEYYKDNSSKLQLKNEYIEFENKINSTFYNVDSYVKLELLDSKKEDKLVYLIKFKDSEIKNYPEIKFNGVTYNNKIDNDHNRLFKLYEIKANYNLEDILKFFRLCFDLECKYIVKLNFTELTDDDNDDGIYKYNYKSTNYQIPIRILLKAINEGKTYTRARKPNTNENIIIYFDEKPNIIIDIEQGKLKQIIKPVNII